MINVSELTQLPVAKNPIKHAGKSLMFGMLGVTALFGGLVGWAMLTTLDSASHAPGRVVVDSRTQTVQHLEGGIISEILVQNGQKVEVGTPLVRLSEVQLRADLTRLQNQYEVAKGTFERLQAERMKASTVTFSDDVPLAIQNSQRALFNSRRDAIESKTKILKEKIISAEMEIKGLKNRQGTLQKQIGLFQGDVARKKTLVNEKVLVESSLLAPEAQLAEYQKELANAQTNVATSGQDIQTSKLQMVDLKTEFEKEVNTEMKTVEAQMIDANQQITAIKDKLTRTTIIAPTAGYVMNLKYHTTGGVISAGGEVLNIVPNTQKKTIEAQLNPTDIDSVHKGMLSRVNLSSYKVTKVPPLNGRLTYISGDTTINEKTGQSYYTIYVELDETENKIPAGVELTPGMPVDVFVVNGERTPMDYFLAPIKETLRYSFTEE